MLNKIIEDIQQLENNIIIKEKEIASAISKTYDKMILIDVVTCLIMTVLIGFFLGLEIAFVAFILFMCGNFFLFYFFLSEGLNISQIVDKKITKKLEASKEMLISRRNNLLRENQTRLIAHINDYYHQKPPENRLLEIKELKLAFIDWRLNFATDLLIKMLNDIEVDKIAMYKIKQYDEKYQCENSNNGVLLEKEMNSNI